MGSKERKGEGEIEAPILILGVIYALLFLIAIIELI
jgi:hypothetical protein